MKKVNIVMMGLIALVAIVCAACEKQNVKLTKAEIADKIKGGWAGQIIGVTYGGPTEFKFVNKMIPDDHKINWNDSSPMGKEFFGSLYDDIYLDITFMDVFEKKGFNAERKEFLKAVGESTYPLWCANRAARMAWLDGFRVNEPTSWIVNPTSNDIDFQIEADYAGLMSPAMPKAAMKFSEQVGRSINSSDGFYCGAYIATMYSLAFVSNDVNQIVAEALKVLPADSRTYKMMNDIIKWYKENPKDWRATWQKVEDNYVKKHDSQQGGASIYAPHNCAYIIIGLLYGGGDFNKTMDISTRCGLDSDCNPSSACGILGTVMGYSKIPANLKKPLEMAEDKLFVGTDYSPKKLYQIGTKQAMEVLKMYGAKIDGENVEIDFQMPAPLPLETVFPAKDTYVKTSKNFVLDAQNPTFKIEFDGFACVTNSDPSNKDLKDFANKNPSGNLGAEIDIFIDGKLFRTAKFYLSPYRIERDFLFANKQMPAGKHTVELKLKNPVAGFPAIKSSFSSFKSK